MPPQSAAQSAAAVCGSVRRSSLRLRLPLGPPQQTLPQQPAAQSAAAVCRHSLRLSLLSQSAAAGRTRSAAKAASGFVIHASLELAGAVLRHLRRDRSDAARRRRQERLQDGSEQIGERQVGDERPLVGGAGGVSRSRRRRPRPRLLPSSKSCGEKTQSRLQRPQRPPRAFTSSPLRPRGS